MMKITTLIAIFSTVMCIGQTVSNGSFTGLQPGTNTFNVTDWSKQCSNGSSPDVCDITSPTFMWGQTTVTASDSPDGGTWLGLVSQGECVEGSITGLTPGVEYTLCFYGANFGSGHPSGFADGVNAQPVITIGGTSQIFSIPMAASTWNIYSMTFTANASTMTLNVSAPDITGGDYFDAAAYTVLLDGFSISTTGSCAVTSETICDGDVIAESTTGYNTDPGYEQLYMLVNVATGNIVATNNTGTFNQSDYGAGNIGDYELYAVNTNDANVITEMNGIGSWATAEANATSLCAELLGPKNYIIENCCGLSVTVTGGTTITCGGTGTITISGLDDAETYNITYPGQTSTHNGVSPTGGVYTIIDELAGTYGDFTIEELGSGCQDIHTSVTLTDPPGFTLSESHSDETCIGADGSIDITVVGASGSQTYQWSGASTSTAEDLSGISAGSYTVVVTDNGCVDSLAIDLVLLNGPSITSFNTDESICSGDSITLNATVSSGILTWSDDQGNGTFMNGDVLYPLVSTVYTVTVDDAGCTASESFTVTVNLSPTFTVTSVDPTACNSSDGELQFVIAPTGTYTIDVDASSITGQVSDGISPIVLGGYGSQSVTSITVTDESSGCSSVDATGWTLTAPGAPVADAGPDAIICDNGSHVLTAINPSGTATSVEWSGGLPDGTTVSPSVTTSYTLSITENGCTATDELIVNVNATPVVSISSPDAEYCDGEPVTPLSASTTEGAITWYDLNNNVEGTGTTLTPTVGSGGSFCYQVQADNNGCPSAMVGPVCVSVNPLPSSPVISGNNSFCAGDAIDLTTGDVNTQWYSDATLVTSLSSGDSYSTTGTVATTTMVYAVSVDPLTGCVSAPSSFAYSVIQGGFLDVVDTVRVCQGSPYSISAVASDSVDWGDGTRSFVFSGIASADTVIFPTVNSNCGVATQQVVIVVDPNPSVNAGPDQVIVRGELVEVQGSGAVTYEWELVSNTAGVNYLNCPTCESTDGYVLFTSIYVLNGWNEYGCLDTDTLLITVDGMINAYVPNIFSPNGDGNNDVFKVEGPEFSVFSMILLNRWGEIVYETKDNTQGWDGTYRGENAGTGVYTYVIEGVAVTGEDVRLGGNVTLVR